MACCVLILSSLFLHQLSQHSFWPRRIWIYPMVMIWSKRDFVEICLFRKYEKNVFVYSYVLISWREPWKLHLNLDRCHHAAPSAASPSKTESSNHIQSKSPMHLVLVNVWIPWYILFSWRKDKTKIKTDMPCFKKIRIYICIDHFSATLLHNKYARTNLKQKMKRGNEKWSMSYLCR